MRSAQPADTQPVTNSVYCATLTTRMLVHIGVYNRTVDRNRTRIWTVSTCVSLAQGRLGERSSARTFFLSIRVLHESRECFSSTEAGHQRTNRECARPVLALVARLSRNQASAVRWEIAHIERVLPRPSLDAMLSQCYACPRPLESAASGLCQGISCMNRRHYDRLASARMLVFMWTSSEQRIMMGY